MCINYRMQWRMKMLFKGEGANLILVFKSLVCIILKYLKTAYREEGLPQIRY